MKVYNVVAYLHGDTNQHSYPVGVFGTQMIAEMVKLKVQHSGVEEIEIFALKSVHIDCDLDDDTWHGINIGIVTDKLIVDDSRVNDGSFCWNVSGEKAKDQSKGKFPNMLCSLIPKCQMFILLSETT